MYVDKILTHIIHHLAKNQQMHLINTTLTLPPSPSPLLDNTFLNNPTFPN